MLHNVDGPHSHPYVEGLKRKRLCSSEEEGILPRDCSGLGTATSTPSLVTSQLSCLLNSLPLVVSLEDRDQCRFQLYHTM